MSGTKKPETENMGDGRDVRTPVAKYIKSMPLIRPGRLHRAKMRLYIRFPTLGLKAEKKATARLEESAE